MLHEWELKDEWNGEQETTKKHMHKKMKIVVIGGSGLIGKKLVQQSRQQGHEVVAASPSSGVNTSPVKDWRKRWPVLRSSLTSQTRRRARTRPSWNSSRRPAATSLPRKPPPA